ncbi:MAG TPA: histidine kinase dimerization/phospho-acceptor domain-containing protein [Candidatus Dormibacteraeota bacterium]|nr:histidine kinase dimerization/phospho-acceptor domain-containing protein [Candidatus Dormibacteraeota bacterium]
MATGETAVGGGPDKPDPDRVLVHDFRNLLAVIINYCELIAAETTDPEAIKADITEIRTAAERAIELTEQLRHRKPEASSSETAPDNE